MWHTDFIHIFFSMFDNFPVPCTPGTYRDGSVTDCTECPQNTVSEEEGARTCTSCQLGHISNSEMTKCGNYFTATVMKLYDLPELVDKTHLR